MENGKFSAGHLENPRDDDKRFETLADAEKAAIAGSYDDYVWGVWQDSTGEIIAVVYQQQSYH